MKDKTVLITGATSGIGEALFYHYAGLGYQVIACGRNREKLDKNPPSSGILKPILDLITPEAFKP